MIGKGILNRYRRTVGGGHSSAELAGVMETGNLSASARKFFDICQRHAIMALNESRIGHQFIPAFTLLFTVANPLVASLVSNPHTLALGLEIGKVPILATVWRSNKSGEPRKINLRLFSETDYEDEANHSVNVGELFKRD